MRFFMSDDASKDAFLRNFSEIVDDTRNTRCVDAEMFKKVVTAISFASDSHYAHVLAIGDTKILVTSFVLGCTNGDVQCIYCTDNPLVGIADVAMTTNTNS